MIFGISHITLSCTDVDVGIGVLQSVGFTRDFLERDAPNFLGKAMFLEEYQANHSLALCTGGKGVAVELVQHRTTAPSTSSPVSVVFEGNIPNTPETGTRVPIGESRVGILNDVFGKDNEIRVWDELSTYYYLTSYNANTSAKVKAVVQPVVSLDDAERLWCGELGATVIKRGETSGQRWSYLCFRAPVPQWSMDFVLLETATIPEYKLDSYGVTCTVFLCRSLSAVSERLQSNFSVQTSGMFEMVVNGKKLKIEVFFSSLCGFIECIEIQR